MTGKTLRQWRLSHGLTQQAIASEVGISKSAVTQWELGLTFSGKPLSPRIVKQLVQMAQRLGLPSPVRK